MSDWYRITNEAEVASPALLLYPDRIQENLRRMVVQAGGTARLRPHVKTHKLPQVLALELAHGITKFKAATLAECEVCALGGAPDVLLAYQPVGPNQNRLIDLIRKYPKTLFSSLVDNLGTVQELGQLAKKSNLELALYLDLNVGMNRTGIIPGDDAFTVYQALESTPGIKAAGLHAYDGHLHDANHSALLAAARAAFVPVWALRDRLGAAGMKVPKIIASGTPTFPLLAQFPNIEVGCGTTVLWDFGQAESCPELDYLVSAILIMRVVSRPTASRLCLDLGHKAVASEMPHPRVRIFGLEDAQVAMHSEEHLVLETPKAPEYQPGDVLYGIPRHVCPTVALYSEVWSVKNRRATELWEVTGRRRRITV